MCMIYIYDIDEMDDIDDIDEMTDVDYMNMHIYIYIERTMFFDMNYIYICS